MEHNEEKIKDLSVSLFNFEQRIEKLEGGFSSMQIDMGGKIAETVGSKFTSNLHVYLPKVKAFMNQTQAF